MLTVENITKGRAVELEAGYALDNEKCHFVPHVQAISLGQWIELKNTDPVLHTADAVLGQQTLFNVALWPGRAVRKAAAYPGVVRINCGVHSWMNAYVVVTDNPYHAVTDLYGAYEIDDVPLEPTSSACGMSCLGRKRKKCESRRAANWKSTSK